jgi:HK97 family phage prohead protease
MADITVVLGPPASGKSSYIQEHKADGDVVIDFDAMAQALGSDTPHEAPEAVGQVGFAARTAAIARIFDGLEVAAWIIQTNMDEVGIARYIEGGAKFVIIDPGKEAVIAQAEADNRPASTYDLIDKWYEDPPVVPESAMKAGEVMKKEPTSGIKLMPVAIKSFAKAAEDGDELNEGEFIGYASVFGNKDSAGDVVVQGAFLETLAQYGEKGAGIPAYWSHRMDDPMMNIGQTVEAKEDEHGLRVRVKLDMDNPNAAYAHKLIKEGRVSQMSFAYDVKEWGFVETEDDQYFELRKLNLHEVSVVPVGANQETELLAVKSILSGVKAGRKLSTKNEDRLAQARDLISDVLSEVAKSDEEEVSGEDPKAGKAEERVSAKAEDQAQDKAQDGDPDAALALIALAVASGSY